MPTIETTLTTTSARGRVRRAWPALLVLTLVVLLAWRALDGVARAGSRDAPDAHVAAALGTRTFEGLELDVPVGWTTLDRTRDHVVWGSADRSHTVTLAATEASLLPLPGVVAAVARDSSRALPGMRLQARPLMVDLGARAPRGDAASLLRFMVDQANRPSLRIAQVWRRDTRGGLDIVATWTSSDGSWPASPTASIPQATASG